MTHKIGDIVVYKNNPKIVLLILEVEKSQFTVFTLNHKDKHCIGIQYIKLFSNQNYTNIKNMAMSDECGNV